MAKRTKKSASKLDTALKDGGILTDWSGHWLRRR